jgi:hypothetical protein
MGFRCPIGKPKSGWDRLGRDKEKTIWDYDSRSKSVLGLTYIGLTSTKGKWAELRKERGQSESSRRNWLERGLCNLRLIRIRANSIQSLN